VQLLFDDGVIGHTHSHTSQLLRTLLALYIHTQVMYTVQLSVRKLIPAFFTQCAEAVNTVHELDYTKV
jgi:hypothetical protein